MLKKTALSAAVAVTLGTGATTGVVQAATFLMTFMDFPGSTNPNVSGTVDTTAGTGTISSNGTGFNGHQWTGTVIAGFEATTDTAWSYTTGEGASVSGSYTFTLGAGQVAMGILFDWSTSSGIPVLNILNADGTGVDMDSNGTVGTSMQSGPFQGSPVGFNRPVPVPAAVWLFGSGLVGLVGVARRRKTKTS